MRERRKNGVMRGGDESHVRIIAIAIVIVIISSDGRDGISK